MADKSKPKGDGIRDAMTGDEIEAAGLAIDLPFEAASGDPKPLQYSDGQSFEDKYPHLFKPETSKGKGGDAGT